jgi:hypothetical protein
VDTKVDAKIADALLLLITKDQSKVNYEGSAGEVLFNIH